MPLGEHEVATAESGAPGERRAGSGNASEPRLQELLDDPMMSLVWRRDGLEPSVARATVRSLQALVRGRGDEQPVGMRRCALGEGAAAAG